MLETISNRIFWHIIAGFLSVGVAVLLNSFISKDIFSVLLFLGMMGCAGFHFGIAVKYYLKFIMITKEIKN